VPQSPTSVNNNVGFAKVTPRFDVKVTTRLRGRMLASVGLGINHTPDHGARGRSSRSRYFKAVLHRIQTTPRVLKPLSMLMKSTPSDLLLGLRFALYSYCESFGKGSLLL
jgi:hypothetical protein